MSKRSNGTHLSDAEKASLHRRIKLGEKTPQLARLFNIAERTVDVHRAKINGTHRSKRTEVACVTTDAKHVSVQRVCWAAQCFQPVDPGEKWCAAHSYRPPEQSEQVRLKMVAGR